jgi:hypothetical protein
VITEEQFGKLPRYVQHELEKLRADVAWYKHKYEAISGKTSRVFVNRRLGSENPGNLHLPEDESITFKVEDDTHYVGDGAYIEVELSSSRDHIEVRGRDGLLTALDSSNRMRIYHGRSLTPLR